MSTAQQQLNMEGINIPTEEALRSYILQTASGPKAMEANRNLAQLLQEAQEKPIKASSSYPILYSFSETVDEPMATMEAPQIEDSRAWAEKLLFLEAEMIFTTTKEVSSAEDAEQQNNSQQCKFELLEMQMILFEKQILFLNEQLDLLKRASESTEKNFTRDMLTSDWRITAEFIAKSPFNFSYKRTLEFTGVAPPTRQPEPLVPLATYTSSTLKAIQIDSEEEANSKSSLEEALIPSPLKCPEFPDFILDVLNECKGLLTPLATYRLKGTFGKGPQARVYKAVKLDEDADEEAEEMGTEKSTEKVTALKVACLDSDNFQAAIAQVRFTPRQLLDHPNLLSSERASLFQSQSAHYFLALALEPMLDGSLHDYIKFHWPERQIGCVLKQALAGLGYLHSKKIVHNDIKPSNLFLSNGVLKIANFGRAFSLNEVHWNFDELLRTDFIPAPEVAQFELNWEGSSQEWSTAVDIWSLGVTLFAMLENKYPFDGNCIFSSYCIIAEKGIKLSENETYSKAVKNFFLQMTQVEPGKRLSADQLLKYPFIGVHASNSDKLDEFIKQCQMAYTQHEHSANYAE